MPTQQTITQTQSTKILTNKRLFAWHGWLGLNFGLLLFIICLSGTVAALSYEIDWLLDEAIRVSPQESRFSLGEIHQRIQATYPQAAVFAMAEPRGPYTAIQAGLNDPDRGTVIVYANQYTGEIIADRTVLNIKNFFRIFHKQFFIISTPFTVNGVIIVGLLGLALLLSVITGVLLLSGRIKSMFRLRWHKGIRVFWVDFHRFSGMWALIFSLLFALTGVWYFIEKVADISEAEFARADPADYAKYGYHLQLLPVDTYLERVKQAKPDLEISHIVLPTKAGDLVNAFGQASAILVRNAANSVSLDPFTGEVVRIRDGTQFGLLDRWLHTVDPLHFGDFGGLLTKSIWFVFGLLLSLSIPVGTYIWYKRLSKKGIPRRSRKAVIFSSLFMLVILLLASVFTTLGLLRMVEMPRAVQAQSLGTQPIGPWSVNLIQQRDYATGKVAGYHMQLSDKTFANVQQAYVVVWEKGEAKPTQVTLGRKWHYRQGELANLINSTSISNIELHLQDWEGRWYQRDFRPLINLPPRVAPIARPPVPISVLIFISVFFVIVFATIFYWFRFAQRSIPTKA